MRMLDQAGIAMAQGKNIALERLSGVNDNMKHAHFHNYYELYFLESGERIQCLNDSCCTMVSNDLIFFPAYHMHYSYGRENVPFQRILLYFDRSMIDSPALLERLNHSAGLFHPSPVRARLIHTLLEELLHKQNQNFEFHELYMQSILKATLANLLQEKQILPASREINISRIRQILNYIHLHYYEHIDLASLSRQFYISQFYLCRKFKETTNRTVSQYINSTRIMNAQRKFWETDLSVTEVCQSCGFTNLTNFNRVFKSITGMTPSGYKRSVKISNEVKL